MQVINPEGLGLDARVVVFAAFISIGTALVIGLTPALRMSSFQITEHLKDGSGATRNHRSRFGFDPQVLLVGAQVSLALMLLVGVCLLGSTVGRLLGVDEGFRTERLLSFDFSIRQSYLRYIY